MAHRTAFPADADCRTQRRLAREGIVSPEMARVAEREGLDAETRAREVARGRMIIPANVHHADARADGDRHRARACKINANIGTSPTTSTSRRRSRSSRSPSYGADTVMDLSTGGEIDEIRAARSSRARPSRSARCRSTRRSST